MAKIDNYDLGTCRVFNKSFARRYVGLWTGDGYNHPQDVNSKSRGWSIRGVRASPTAAEMSAFEGLNNYPQPVILDLNSIVPGFIQWVFVERLVLGRRNAVTNLYTYDLTVRKVPGIGSMYIQTAGVHLHSLNYRASLKRVDPMVGGSFNKVWSASRLVQTFEFYLDNDNNAITTAFLEFFACADISTIKIWGWKDLTPHDWSLIGDWGGDAWDVQKNFTGDGPGPITHVFRVDKGVRGEVTANVGTISNSLGNYNRVLAKITLLQADATPLTNTSLIHANYQLLLKVEITSTSREAVLRPYPIVTYITGGLGPEPA